MELRAYIQQLERVNEMARQLADVTKTVVDIICDEAWYDIVIIGQDGEKLYTSQCDNIDELHNEISAILVGANLASGIEV